MFTYSLKWKFLGESVVEVVLILLSDFTLMRTYVFHDQCLIFCCKYLIKKWNFQMQMDAYSAQLATSSPPQMLAGSQLGPTTQIASPPYLQQMTAGGGAMSPFVLHQQPPVALSPPIVTSPLVLPAGASYVNNVPDVNTNTFRLHQNNVSLHAIVVLEYLLLGFSNG